MLPTAVASASGGRASGQLTAKVEPPEDAMRDLEMAALKGLIYGAAAAWASWVMGKLLGLLELVLRIGRAAVALRGRNRSPEAGTVAQ